MESGRAPIWRWMGKCDTQMGRPTYEAPTREYTHTNTHKHKQTHNAARHYVVTCLPSYLLTTTESGWLELAAAARRLRPCSSPETVLSPVSPRRVATTRPSTQPPRVSGGGGSTPRPSADPPPPRWPRLPQPPCPTLSPTPFYLYITVLLTFFICTKSTVQSSEFRVQSSVFQREREREGIVVCLVT